MHIVIRRLIEINKEFRLYSISCRVAKDSGFSSVGVKVFQRVFLHT